MFIKNYHISFILSLMSGSIAAISSNTWFTAWLGLEINLMSMIPLILIKATPNLSEAAIKYFLAQALASVILIFSVTLALHTSLTKTMNLQDLLILSSLALKAGAPPLHFWFPQITPLLSWSQTLIIFTWQKMAPLLLMVSTNSLLTLALSCLAVMVGALGGLNQINLKPLLTFSSIAHTGWLIMASLLNLLTWSIYFIIYCFLAACITTTCNKSLSDSATELMESKNPQSIKYLFAFNLFSLGGLPPFLGFTAKISILTLALSFNMKLIMLIFILSSLISLYYYYRLTYLLPVKNQTMKQLSLPNTSTNFIMISICVAANVAAPLIVMLT